MYQKFSSTLRPFLLAQFLISGGVKAAISVQDFEMTTSTVSFSLVGNLPSTPPTDTVTVIYFANADFNRNPGAILPDSFVEPASVSWTGGRGLQRSFPLFTVATNDFDAFGMRFSGDLTAGESMDGTLTAVFPDGTFDPDGFDQLNVFWGQGGPSSNLDIEQGVYLTTVVPEPSLPMTLVAGLSSMILIRKRRAFS